MNTVQLIGKIVIICGLILVLAGIGLFSAGKTGWSGRLPGDIVIRKENFTVFLPVTTSILLSLILSALFYIFFRK